MNWKLLFQPTQILCKQSGKLSLKDSKIFGKGVFAQAPFRAGDLIEACPLIIVQGQDIAIVRNSRLYWYYFVAYTPAPCLALALGYGSVYNHACPANARFQLQAKKQLLLIHAHVDIAAGTEITLNYNGAPADPSPVSFWQDGIVHSDHKK